LLLERLLAEHGPALVGSPYGAASRLRGGSGMAAPTAGAMPSASTAKPKGYRMGDEDKPVAKVVVLPYLLTAEEATSADSSVVTVHPKKAEELGLMAGDTVRLKGRRDRETLCALQVSDKVGEGAVQLSAVTRSNLRLTLGDSLKMYRCDSAKHGTSIKVLPFSDTMAGLTNEELKEQLVRASPHDRSTQHAAAPAYRHCAARAVPPHPPTPLPPCPPAAHPRVGDCAGACSVGVGGRGGGRRGAKPRPARPESDGCAPDLCGGPHPSPHPNQVEPYFKGADGAEAPYRPVTEGDVIQLQVGTQLAEFKVVETEPPRHCIVSPDTDIDMEEEPLERSLEEVPHPPPANLLSP
jgi:hypothetical protein